MKRSDNASVVLYHAGFSDGVDDCDNKEPSLAEEIDQDRTNARAISYGTYYLTGYAAGYQDAASKSWFVVSLDKKTRKVKSYYVRLENGNEWTEDRSKAAKFENKKVVYEKLNDLLCSLGRGEYGVIWEKNG